MANRDIKTRAGKGSSLSATDHDQNINALHGTVEQQTGTTYTVIYTDQGKTIELNNASMVCTLDAIATIAAAIDTDNFSVKIKNVNAADATVQRSGTDTIDGATSITLGQNETVSFQTNSSGGIWSINAGSVTRNTAETLANKTLPSPDISDAAFSGTQTGFVGDISGQAGTIAGQGLLATMNSVSASEIDANAVHTSELYTVSPASVSTTTLGANFTMTGGLYVFCPQLRTTDATFNVYLYGGTSADVNPYTYSTAYVTVMRLGSTDSSAFAESRWIYVAASPPHDMGDGDIPAFIYAVIDNTTGDVESISFAEEPVWLANGPTNAMPDFVTWNKAKTKKKKWKRERIVPDEVKALPIAERMQAIAKLPMVDIEITNADVHADMDIIPHPFQGNDLTGKTVVMLDPVCDCVRDLAELNKSGEDVHDIIRSKYITIGNIPMNRVTPAGLLIPAVGWRKGKR